eukprot:2799557-Prymnesium_polylepis.3
MPYSKCGRLSVALSLARDGRGGRGGGLVGESRDRGGLRALMGCPVGLNCLLPGLKRTIAKREGSGARAAKTLATM